MDGWGILFAVMLSLDIFLTLGISFFESDLVFKIYIVIPIMNIIAVESMLVVVINPTSSLVKVT